MKAHRLFFLFTLFSLLPALSMAEVAPPHEQANFLAGLPVHGSSLDRLTDMPGVQTHSKAFGTAWETLEKNQLSKIRDWAPQHLGATSTATDPLFYMFSGPDFLYAHTYFPRASTYVFCGIEPVGTLPDVAALPPEALQSALGNLRESLDSVLSFSFFITSKMKTDLSQTQLTGTLPVLYVFLAREGCHIDSVELVNLSEDGAFVAEKTAHSGVKIIFTHPGSAPQTLYYFCSDLSSWAIKRHPGFIKFCDSLGRGCALLKAASYLMHLNEFDAVRDFLLSHSRLLLQDDSGIPLEHFVPELWDLHHLGHYAGPIERFTQHYQPALAAAYQAQPSTDYLPFSYGYRWKARESSLMLAIETNAIPKALPLTEEQAANVLRATPR